MFDNKSVVKELKSMRRSLTGMKISINEIIDSLKDEKETITEPKENGQVVGL